LPRAGAADRALRLGGFGEIQRREAAASEAAAALPEPLCSFEASLDGPHVPDLLARSPLAVVPSATRLLTSPMEEVAEKIAESHTTPVANGISYTPSSLRREGERLLLAREPARVARAS